MTQQQQAAEAAKRKQWQKYGELLIPRNDLSIYKSYQIEVPLNDVNQGSKNKFTLNEILNPKATGSVIFTGVDCFTDDLLKKSESGRPVVTSTDAAKLAVTLAYGSREDIYLYPYTGLISVVNYGMIRRLKNIQLTLTNCYVQIMDSAVPIAAGKSAIFNFYYRDKE